MTIDVSSMNADIQVLGGSGNDRLHLSKGSASNHSGSVELDLRVGSNIQGFENVSGSGHADIIIGDSQSNEISGGSGEDKLLGGVGNDTLDGGDGNDHLDGGTGVDTITGGSGTDTFILRAGDGGSSLNDADIFKDFKAGEDVLGLDRSLRYSDLVITQGEAGNSADTVIKDN